MRLFSRHTQPAMFWTVLSLTGWLLTGCGTASIAGSTVTPESVTPTLSTLSSAVSTVDGSEVGSLVTPITPTVRPTLIPTAVPDVVTIWWPAALYPAADSPAERLLLQALDDYRVTHGSTIVIRVKRNDGKGSILETLRSGNLVAPTAMPEIALVRRADLVQAATEKLIIPIDMTVLTIDDLFPAALAQGKVSDLQYGVPYALEVEHAIYRTTALTTPPLNLNDLLAQDQAYLFPAGVNKGISTTLLAQYIAAGGRLTDDNGLPTIDSEALNKVLDYYERALDAKLAGPQLLDYMTVTQYWPMLGTGKINAVAANSTLYLAQRDGLTAVEPIAPPMVTGSPVIALDAWQWVITTTNPSQQSKALNVMAWLMRTQEHSQYMRAIGIIPARRSALAAWDGDQHGKYAAFMMALLDSPTIPPIDTVNPVVAGALQSALSDVLSGRKSAATAANDALAIVQQAQ